MTEKSQPLFLQRVMTLVHWRRLILLNTVVVAVAAILVSLILPKSYRATASVFPPQDEGPLLGSLPSVASVAARALGQSRSGSSLFSSPSDLYAAILKSRSVGSEIVGRHNLLQEYKVPNVDDALQILATQRKVRVGSEGVVSLSVVATDPEKAAAIANDFIELLDAKSRERRRSTAGSVRAFLERRVAETRDSLGVAERRLQEVQEQTGILVPEDQARALVESAVQIELGRRMREVELGMLRAQVGPTDPDRARLTREIDLLEAQLREIDRGTEPDTVAYRVPLAEFPGRAATYGRALRDLKIQEAVFELLTEQYETYRILELRDTPTLQILDSAVPPERRWRPIRWLICVIATGMAFLLSCALALGLDSFVRIRRDDPEQWEMLRKIGWGLHPRHWLSSRDDPSAP